MVKIFSKVIIYVKQKVMTIKKYALKIFERIFNYSKQHCRLIIRTILIILPPLFLPAYIAHKSHFDVPITHIPPVDQICSGSYDGSDCDAIVRISQKDIEIGDVNVPVSNIKLDLCLRNQSKLPNSALDSISNLKLKKDVENVLDTINVGYAFSGGNDYATTSAKVGQKDACITFEKSKLLRLNTVAYPHPYPSSLLEDQYPASELTELPDQNSADIDPNNSKLYVKANLGSLFWIYFFTFIGWSGLVLLIKETLKLIVKGYEL